MAVNDGNSGTEASSTVDTAAQGFAALLPDDWEDQETSETQPTQESPESESSEEEEASEASESEDESAETDEESEDAEEAPGIQLDPSTKVRVTIDGQETEVTLDEALKGYSRQADYTRKTQELASQRKTQEAEFQAVRGERAKYATLLTEVEQALQNMTGPEPDWVKVARENPTEYPVMRAEWEQRQSEIQAVSAERQRAQQAVQRDQAEARQRYLQDEQTKLLEALPEWKDAEKSKAEKAAIVSYAEQLGFTKDELSQVVDHRAIVMLRKAMLYDKAQAAKPALVKRIEKVRKATPGPSKQVSKPASKATQAAQRLAKSGRVDDAAEAFANMLDDSL